ncbi:hypothetical protein [Klebsiella pneumoniae]|uniref:hypothetical protein n=1 Tax=Klebsiella pneumoniae TaxID=573 RepID=UPI0030EDBAAB
MTITLQAVNELIASLESAGELSIRETKVMALAKAYQQLAAENVALKSFGGTLHEIKSSLVGGGHGHMAKADMQAQSAVMDVIFDAFDAIETPATDRIVAGIKADGRAEGINFAAGRLAAAFNHGFVDKPMAEVFDVVRMILTAKEDLANDPAADGLSGEYAEKSLAEWEAALREGADK